MRTDLNMRKGKMVAQGAHASSLVLLSLHDEIYHLGDVDGVKEAYEAYVFGTHTKVCVGVVGALALHELQTRAQALGIPTQLVTDQGKTEFGGVPTETCLAVGPWWSDEVDKITGHLRLL